MITEEDWETIRLEVLAGVYWTFEHAKSLIGRGLDERDVEFSCSKPGLGDKLLLRNLVDSHKDWILTMKARIAPSCWHDVIKNGYVPLALLNFGYQELYGEFDRRIDEEARSTK